MTEFEELQDLDIELCARLQTRLVWYFGEKDGWVTHHHAADIADACPRSEVLNCEKVGGVGEGLRARASFFSSS